MKKTLFILLILCTAHIQAALITQVSQMSGTPTLINFSQFNSGWLSPSVQVGGLVGKDIVWSSTNSGAVLGNSGYGLNTNGSWTSARNGYAGVNTSTGSMWFTFAENVSSVLGFINYAAGGGYPDAYIKAYNSSGVLLESYNLITLAPISTPSGTDLGAYRGIQRATADIAKFELVNAYIVIDDLHFVAGNVVVPEVGTLFSLIFAFAFTYIIRKMGKK